MRQHLFLQNFLRVTETPLSVETSGCSTITNKVQGDLSHCLVYNVQGVEERTYLTVLNDETVVNTWLQHFQHLVVLHIVANVFKDISVRDDTKCTENDPDRNVDLDIRNSSFHDISSLPCRNQN